MKINTARKSLNLGITFSLIQQIRLAHALSESNFQVIIPNTETSKFNPLKEKFGMDYINENVNSLDISTYIKISHEIPMTTIGNCSRNLIFPHAIVKYCKSLWPTNRIHRYSFIGLVTTERKEILRKWTKLNLPKSAFEFDIKLGYFSKIRHKLTSIYKPTDVEKKQIGELIIWSSVRGRYFPTKSWDNEYFETLSQSQFVLCPSGDYTWSYRFFESILCGAIPIIEKYCDAYQGFKFLNLEDKVEDIRWSEKDALYNYNLCVDKITIPREHLNNELELITK